MNNEELKQDIRENISRISDLNIKLKEEQKHQMTLLEYNQLKFYNKGYIAALEMMLDKL